MDFGPPTRPLLATPGLAPGVRLAGRYRLEQLIGRGGMAEVFAARDELLHRPVAVKVFPPGATQPETNGSSEMRLLASLNHPGLVTVHDAGEPTADPGTPAFLVMELISGPTLAQQLLHGPLEVDQVRAVGAQVAAALSYVHARGLVHRDVKPANILLTDPLTAPSEPIQVKLADFGIARLVDATRATAPGTALGTASYLSPEQVRGEPVEPATDVYALGLTLLEALTGELTYPGTAAESAVARLHRPPDIPVELGAHWSDLLAGMTALDPAQRPSAAGVAGALAAPAPRPAPAAAVPPGRPREDRDAATTVYASPWLRWTAMPRRTRTVTLAAVGALTVLVIAALSLTQDPAPSTPPARQQVSYPAVPGNLGTPLHRLQRAVQP